MLPQITGQNAWSLMPLDAGKKVADFHVGVTVASLFDLAALAEQAVGLIKQQHYVPAMCRIEQGIQVLFCFADILAYQQAEIDPKQRPFKSIGLHFGGKGLARAGGAGKQRHWSTSHPPLPVDDYLPPMGDP